MKQTLRIILTLFVFGALSITTACAQMYISGNVNAFIANNSDLSVSDVNTGEISFGNGFGGTAAFGNDVNIFDTEGRAELELAYKTSNINEYAGTEIDIEIKNSSLMFNAYHDYSQFDLFTPFVGIGFGVAQVEAALDTTLPSVTVRENVDDTVMAYQVILGGTFAASENISIDLQYRYYGSDKPKFNAIEIENISHNFMAGVRYSF